MESCRLDFTTLAFSWTYVRTYVLISSDPVKIDTGIVIQCASWSPKGSILAIGGAHQSSVLVCMYVGLQALVILMCSGAVRKCVCYVGHVCYVRMCMMDGESSKKMPTHSCVWLSV